jgi:hypothetical protein
MWEARRAVRLLSLVILVSIVRPVPNASAQKAAAKPKDTVVAGIMFDHDRKNNWMTVKADGEEQPVKYLIDPSNQNLAESLKSVFNAARVQVKYRVEGDTRKLVAIQRQILDESGTVTGTVVKVHNDFWIELKPKKGPANAFAPGANYNDKAFMAKLKSLQPGDSVTIQFNTDFERRRILAMRKNPPPARPASKTKQTVAPAKEKK